jgi:mono/diheme cytochrome c family protein
LSGDVHRRVRRVRRPQRCGRRLGAPVAAFAGAIAAVSVAAATFAGCGPPTSGLSAAELYGEHCARCHGDHGRGDPRALGLSPNVDLSRSELLRKRSRGQIFLRITQGYGSMPAFSHKLERGDVELLVDYVLELEAH